MSPAAARPSDPGLAGERTSLAWARIGLSLLGVPTGLAAYAAGRDVLPALVLMILAATTGLLLLVLSLRRQRAAPDMLRHSEPLLRTGQVLVTTAATWLLAFGSVFLVLR